MDLPDFLSREPTGEIRLTGHRIGLFHLVDCYTEGYSPEMVVCHYPTLPLALVYKVFAYYLEHRSEVDAYVASCREELSRQRKENPRRIDAATLRQRLEAQRSAGRS
jgi:uncharacterized protein (DUF433 family)